MTTMADLEILLAVLIPVGIALGLGFVASFRGRRLWVWFLLGWLFLVIGARVGPLLVAFAWRLATGSSASGRIEAAGGLGTGALLGLAVLFWLGPGDNYPHPIRKREP